MFKQACRLAFQCILSLRLLKSQCAQRYPIFAQQNYSNPREANGRIVCANCHLAQKSVELEVPQAVLADTVFEAVVRIPYNLQVKQVLGNGKSGDLNVGAVLILPDNFQLAPPDRISAERSARMGKVYFQPYSADKKNILVVGPVPGKQYQELIFPILTPNPETKKGVFYLKYPIYLGGNRGRGQVYPDGSKSNNTVYTASVNGVITDITPVEKKGGFQIVIESKNGSAVTETIPPGPELVVQVGQKVQSDEALTNNPNIGGFGQAETEIVLQDARRIEGLLVFFLTVLLTQVFLVLKKKQFEKVQLAEINFLLDKVLF
jgi:apocytochrome f